LIDGALLELYRGLVSMQSCSDFLLAPVTNGSGGIYTLFPISELPATLAEGLNSLPATTTTTTTTTTTISAEQA